MRVEEVDNTQLLTSKSMFPILTPECRAQPVAKRADAHENVTFILTQRMPLEQEVKWVHTSPAAYAHRY